MTVLSAPASSLDELLGELSRTLWTQRGLIEVLQYRLEVQQLICLQDRAHLLSTAVDEVEAAMDEIRRSERARDQIVARCAAALGVGGRVSLAELRGRVDEPWAGTLAEHQDALLALVGVTEKLAATNRELVAKGAAEARALLEAVGGIASDTSYTRNVTAASGGTGRGLVPPTLVDRTA